eukprot:g39761.t1
MPYSGTLCGYCSMRVNRICINLLSEVAAKKKYGWDLSDRLRLAEEAEESREPAKIDTPDVSDESDTTSSSSATSSRPKEKKWTEKLKEWKTWSAEQNICS